MAIKAYEVKVGDGVEIVITGDVDAACLQFSHEFGLPLQPWDFKEIEKPPFFWWPSDGVLT